MLSSIHIYSCSRHKKLNKNVLMNNESCSIWHIIFGDRQRRLVLGKGTLMMPGLLRLENVPHVNSLKANLVSIRQLYDRNLVITFTKDNCVVYDDVAQCVLTRLRSSVNCNMFQKLQVYYNTSCLITEVWHQKLAHVNYKTLMKIVEVGATRGLHKLTQKKDGVCGHYPIRKQRRASHKVL